MNEVHINVFGLYSNREQLLNEVAYKSFLKQNKQYCVKKIHLMLAIE